MYIESDLNMSTCINMYVITCTNLLEWEIGNQMVENTLICTNKENSKFNNRMKGIAHSNTYSCVYNVPQGFL